MSRKLSIPILGQGDPNRPKEIRLVGRYALGVDWADGHGSIYPFDQLRRACPCGGGCADLATPPAAATWPQEIQRLDDALRVAWSDGHESRYPYVALRAGCRCAGCTGGH